MTQGVRDVLRATALTVVLACTAALAAVPAAARAAAPVLTITAPAAGYINDPLPIFTGTSDDSADALEVTIYEGAVAGGSIAETLTPLEGVSGGAWSAETTSFLADGTYTAVAAQGGGSGSEFEAGQSASVTFVVDTAAPSPEVSSPGVYLKNPSPAFTGKLGTKPGDLAAAEVVIRQGLSAGGPVAVAGAATVSAGNWSYVPPVPLADGPYTVEVLQHDEAGNTGSSTPVSFTIDTAAPVVTLQAPAAYLKSRTVTLKGAAGAQPGDDGYVVVKLYKGSVASGAPFYESPQVATEGASWSDTLPTLAADGVYTAVVTQADEAGNSTTSPPATFTVDTKAPAVTITAPRNAEVLHVSRATFSGAAGTATGDLPEVALQIYEVGEFGEETKVQEIQGVAVAPGGSWSAVEGLQKGHYAVVVEQADAAGNVARTKPVPFTVETESPDVTLTPSGGFSRREGVLYSSATPTFSGTASSGGRDSDSITLRVYAGPGAAGEVVREASVERSGGAWSSAALEALPAGIYTAQAEQTAKDEEEGFSAPVTFTVDDQAPRPAVSSPAPGDSLPAGSVIATGTAGTAPGDQSPVTVRVYAGSEASGAPSLSVTVPSGAGAWSAPLGGLSAGTYTVVAQQSDDVGNAGYSAPVTFFVVPPSSPPPPAASFSWFPATPHVGEPVSIVSTSTDPASAIVGYSWSLAGNGVFEPGGQTIGTAFTSAGNHVVQLTVVDQNGAASTVSETIPVTAVPVSLMQPFPVVRIAGTEFATGVKIRLLTVQAPIGAKVTISCKGRSCPSRTTTAFATKVKGKPTPGSSMLSFHRFQRLLPPGTTLEIKVSKAGVIGKYVRFVARRGKLPTRQDKCLSLIGKPMDCPS